MDYKKIAMEHDKKIALVAHDNKKRGSGAMGEVQPRSAGASPGLCDGHHRRDPGAGAWFQDHQARKRTAGRRSARSAPRSSEDEIDFLIFFWDPLEPQPHDPDVKALLRMAVVWNIPIACNRASADFMISSPLMDGEYDRLVPDYEHYRARKVDIGEAASQVAEEVIESKA